MQEWLKFSVTNSLHSVQFLRKQDMQHFLSYMCLWMQVFLNLKEWCRHSPPARRSRGTRPGTLWRRCVWWRSDASWCCECVLGLDWSRCIKAAHIDPPRHTNITHTLLDNRISLYTPTSFALLTTFKVIFTVYHIHRRHMLYVWEIEIKNVACDY